MGINAIKEILSLVFGLVNVIDDVAVNHLGGLAAVLRFIPIIPKVAPALHDISLVIPQLKDMSDAERAELKAFVASEFNISDDKLELTIEQVLDVAIDLSVLLKSLA